MEKDAYAARMIDLRVELVRMQAWVKESGTRVLCIVEGRDAAGKGGVIRRFVEPLNPRGCRVVALDRPTERERTQWYFQRYLVHLPAGGEIVILDRSWYNRAGLERVNGWATPAEVAESLVAAPALEALLVADGVRLFKLYVAVSRDEQARRLARRAESPEKRWRMTPLDREAPRLWDAYTAAEAEMLARTGTADTPWHVIDAFL